MYDPWDEFVMEHLREFEGKPLKSAETADVKVDQPATAEDQELLTNERAETLAKWLKEKLGEQVGVVRVSNRLVGSPGVIVETEKLTASMRRMLKGMHHGMAASKQDFEINPRHPIIVRLDKMRETDTALAVKVAEQLLDNARAAAGLLEDPRTMVKRMNELLERVLLVNQ